MNNPPKSGNGGVGWGNCCASLEVMRGEAISLLWFVCLFLAVVSYNFVYYAS